VRKLALESGAVVVWLVVAALFIVILFFHMHGAAFSYSRIDVGLRPDEPRPQSGVAPDPNAASQSNVTIAPNGVITRQNFANGIPLDEPLRKFAAEFNTHIDELNADRSAEGRVGIGLDLIGALSALFSAYYEYRKSRKKA
jgi:hypothetical protein